MADQDPPIHESEIPALQSHPVKAEDVHPHPARRKWVGLWIAGICLVVVLNTVGNFIGVKLANDHADSGLRQANKNTDQVHFLVTHQSELICNAIIKSVKQSERGTIPGQTKPTKLQLEATAEFLKGLGCKVPANL